MPSLETLRKTLDKMTPAELRAHIAHLRDQRKIKRRVKKEHTIKGKRKAKLDIKKKFEKMSAEERQELIKILGG